jgi:predicted small secreted protein
MNGRFVAILLLLGCLVGACSTVEGAGHDISDTARWIKDRL